jgi:hypothetical protein
VSANGVILLALFLGPLLALIPFYIRDYRAWWRPNAESFARWRHWLSFTEPLSGRQNHLPRNKEIKTRSAVLWMEETRRCQFRLRLGLTSLASIGQVTWDEDQIRFEGRIPLLNMIQPLLIVLWMDVFVAAAYLLDETAHSLKTVMSAVAFMTVLLSLIFGGMLLFSAWLERKRFRQAYREIKARIWGDVVGG